MTIPAGSGRTPRRMPLLTCLLLAATAALADETPPRTITLAEAVATALARSPVLQAAGAELDAAEGRVVSARALASGPEVGATVARRESADARSTDWGVEVEQAFELGGQRGARRRAAESELEAARSRLDRQRQAIVARVTLAYVEAQRAAEISSIEQYSASLSRQAQDVAQRRLDAGAGTLLDLNVARAARLRADRSALQAEVAAAATRFLLAETMGLPAGEAPAPAADIDVVLSDLPPLPDLLARARQLRPDLLALRRDIEAADARVRLARSLGSPDLVLRAFHEREEQDTDVSGLGVALAFPAPGRRRGAVLEASAGAAGTRAALLSTELEVEREIAEAFARHEAARDLARRLEGEVVASLEENVSLLERSLDAGKVGISEVLIFRNELLAGRREHVQALAEAASARATLEYAAGLVTPPPPAHSENQP